jgi:hypothetical protein
MTYLNVLSTPNIRPLNGRKNRGLVLHDPGKGRG